MIFDYWNQAKEKNELVVLIYGFNILLQLAEIIATPFPFLYYSSMLTTRF